MATGTPVYPTTLDTAATLGPTSGIVAGTTALNAVGTNQGDQLGITNNLINTVVALETAVGVTNSAVTTSLTYGVNHLAAASPYTTTTSSFVIPAAGSPVTLAITSASWPIVGQVVEINDGTNYGFFEITTVTSGVSIAVTNRGYNGNPVSGTMATAASVSLSSAGQATATKAGLLPTPPNTVTTFLRGDVTFATPPSATATVAGYVPTPPNNVTTFLRGDASFSTPPSATSTVSGYVPTPPNNTTQFLRGDAAFASPGVTTTSTNGTFTIPASGSTVAVTIVACTWPIVGQKVYISDGGGTNKMFGMITVVGSSTSITVLNTGDTGNAVSGTMGTLAGVSLVDYQSVVWDKFTAGDNDPPATLYATFDVINNISTLGFNDSATWGAVFKSVLPQFAALGSGIIVHVKWASVAAVTGAAMFGAAYERMNLTFNSDHFGTQVTGTTTTSGTAGVLNDTSITIPYANMGSTVAGDPYRLQIQRIGANGADTLVGNAEVVFVTVESGVL